MHNRSLKSLRDLRPQHLSLLNKIKQAAEDIVQEKYGLERNGIRLFLHYQPSYYHLHVHIVSLSNEGFVGAEVGKAHLLQDVISLVSRYSLFYLGTPPPPSKELSSTACLSFV